MKLFIIFILSFFIIQPIYSQNNLQDGDSCFNKGNYTCSEEKYVEAKKFATGRDKQIIEIRLSKTKWCLEHLNTANKEFVLKNYREAKENYESVLDSNPNDAYAKEQIEKCKIILTPPATTLALSKETLNFPSSGGSERISVNTNSSSYSVSLLPSWCTIQKFADYFVLNCMSSVSNTIRTDYFAVTAGNKTLRVYISQAGNEYANNTLSVSDQNIIFTSDGGKRVIDVTSKARNYKIIQLPKWCSIELKTANWFNLSCNKNSKSQSRTDWFKVVADNEEVVIYVTQLGIAADEADSHKESPRARVRRAKNSKRNDCFNCPKTKDTWGMTVGYIQKTTNYYYGLNKIANDGIQVGVRAEPLFKYGFGLNTGLNLEGYFSDDSGEKYAANVPLHLEYRFNFSKMFNLFVYGGAGFNLGSNSSLNAINVYTTSEYGAGMRINHVQFNVGQSSLLTGAVNNDFKKSFISISYMF